MHAALGLPLVALIAVVVNMVIGIVFGGISGYLGGMVDTGDDAYIVDIITDPADALCHPAPRILR